MPASTIAAPAGSLHLRAYEEVKRLILTGEFPPDTFLSERQLALRFGMSKTPVHVALKRLESEGFVVISPQQGAVVRGLAPSDILDHYEYREALESFASRRMAGRLDELQISAVEESLRSQGDALARGDLPDFVELDADFHLLLVSFLGNREISAAMERLRDKIQLVIVRVVTLHRSRCEESLAEHRDIARHWIDGDAAAAVDAVVEHLDAGRRRILSSSRQ